MMRWIVAAVASLLVAATAHAADAGPHARLAAVRVAMSEEVPFREERHSEILTRPAVFEGVLRYDRESRVMSKIVHSPAALTMTVDDRKITIERDGKARRIALRSRPEVGALLAGFRGLLDGDTDTLEKHFRLDYTETADAWSLRMTPRSKRLRRHVEVVIVDGTDAQVQSICTRMTNGDWQVLALSPDQAGDE